MSSIVYPKKPESFTVLDLLDSRYMAPGGRLHGRHLEALFKQQAVQVEACTEQCSFVRSMLSRVVEAIGSPALASLDREGPQKRSLRPMHSPRFSVTVASHLSASADGEQLARTTLGAQSHASRGGLVSRPASAHSKMLRSTRSAAALLGYETAAPL
jgi:hypothetical protein